MRKTGDKTHAEQIIYKEKRFVTRQIWSAEK